MPLSDDVNLEAIAAASHGYTGADLEAVCREATMDTIVSYMEGLQCMDKNGELKRVPLQGKAFFLHPEWFLSCRNK